MRGFILLAFVAGCSSDNAPLGTGSSSSQSRSEINAQTITFTAIVSDVKTNDDHLEIVAYYDDSTSLALRLPLSDKEKISTGDRVKFTVRPIKPGPDGKAPIPPVEVIVWELLPEK